MGSAPPHVIIVGAGLGGLTLAQTLRKRKIPFSVYERGILERQQGWCLALHSMLEDLLAAMPDDLPPFADSVNHLQPLPLSVEVILYPKGDLSQRIAVEAADGEGKIVRANRTRLREYLATNIPIQYNKAAVGVEEEQSSGGGITVKFADGTTATGDIVVGADGVHSVVRQALLSNIPDPLRTEPLGIIAGEVTLSGAALDRQLELAHSACIVRIPSTPILFMVGLNRASPDGKSADFYWFFAWRDAEAVTADGKPNTEYWTRRGSREEMHAFAVQETGKFDPALNEIVRETPADGIVVPPLEFTTLTLDDQNVPASEKIVLLGDAAHSMPPFRAQAGSHALLDAVKLGDAIERIATGSAEAKQAIAAYQNEVIKRGSEAARASAAGFPSAQSTGAKALGVDDVHQPHRGEYSMENRLSLST